MMERCCTRPESLTTIYSDSGTVPAAPGAVRLPVPGLVLHKLLLMSFPQVIAIFLMAMGHFEVNPCSSNPLLNPLRLLTSLGIGSPLAGISVFFESPT